MAFAQQNNEESQQYPGIEIDQARIIIIVSSVLASLGTALLLLRIYARFCILGFKAPGWSLSFAGIAWVVGILTSIIWSLAGKYGFGSHFETVRDSPNLILIMLFEWVGVVLSLFAAWFGKLSAMVYTLDVQGPTHRRRRWILFILVGVNLALNIGMVPIIFLQCDPIEKLWYPFTSGTCGAGMRAWIYATLTGTWGALTDLALALYPIVMIRSLQIRRRLKVLLCILLGLGVLTAGCAIMKTMSFCALKINGDATFDNGGFVMWSLTELWIILITASMPPLWPVLRRVYHHATSRGRAVTSSVGGNNNKSQNASNGNSARHFFYRYGSEQSSRQHQARLAKMSPFGEWGVVVSRLESREDLAVEDGIIVTRNLSISSEYNEEKSRVEDPEPVVGRAV